MSEKEEGGDSRVTCVYMYMCLCIHVNVLTCVICVCYVIAKALVSGTYQAFAITQDLGSISLCASL